MKQEEPEIIDAEFTVIDPGGSPSSHFVPYREPIVKSWWNLWMFVAVLTITFSVGLCSRYRELERQERLWGAPSHATRDGAAQQAPASRTVEHLTQ